MPMSMDRRHLLAGGMVAAAAWPFGAMAQVSGPVATTRAGRVRGATVDGIHVFKGVRYGASTEGRRFMPPRPPQPWNGVADALDYAAQSPQVSGGDGGGFFRSWANRRPGSEDCLFLNVWTPALRDGKKRPVMVWFHGGGFSVGSGASHGYDGTRLCRRGDVVVVTVNHRLNAFGYGYLAELGGPEMADSGNAGDLDMVLSLRWVRDNIAEFGGDPGNVMIFGESGGGGKVSTLMAMPSAAGLFHRAAVQSGSSLTVLEKDQATENMRKLMAACGVGQAAEMRALPMDRIVEGMRKAQVDFRPVVDGRALPRHPFHPDAPAVSRNVPMLIGTTKDEMTLLIGARDPSVFDLTWDDLPKRAAPYLSGLDAEKALADLRRLYPQARPSDIFFTLATVRATRKAAITQAERKAAQGGAPAYMYLLNWETPVDGGKWKSPHALDIALMFDNVARSESMSGTSPEAQKVADAMSEAWIRFARTGEPGWAPYRPDTRATMVFDVESKVVYDPNREERLMFADAPLVRAGSSR
ncbi:MAG: carboxylesterase/lipase family protein [Pseudomonadota bacterium]